MGIEGVTANLHVVSHNLYTLLYLLHTYNAWKELVVKKCSLAM